MDYWSILEIEPTSDITIIKQAYAKQLKKNHPEDAPEDFQRLREAYEQAMKTAKRLKNFIPAIEEKRDHHEETENHYEETEAESKVVLRDTYTFDMENMQKHLGTCDKKQEELNLNADESKTLDTKPVHKHEPIDNFKKVMTELEFMEKVEALYHDRTMRNDIDKWKDLLSDYLFCNIDTSQKIYSQLLDFLKDNHEVAYDILILINEFFKWAQGPNELIDMFFKEEEIIALAKSEQNIVFIKSAAKILYNKAEDFYKIGRQQQAVEIYAQIIELCQANIDDDIDNIIANSLYNRARFFHYIKKYDVATTDYYKLITYYENYDKKGMCTLVANALLNKAVILTKVGRYNEALSAFIDIVDKFKDNTHEDIINIVATALYNQGICLRNLGRTRESHAPFNEVIQKYSSCESSQIKQLVKDAHLRLNAQSSEIKGGRFFCFKV